MKPKKLKQFRYEVYQNFNKRSDSKLELLDALSCQTSATSVVQLSLRPEFRRQYHSLYKAIESLSLSNDQLRKWTVAHLPAERGRYHHLTVDVTACPRPEAYCLADRGHVYAGKSRGVVRGHQYSVVSILPPVPETEKTWALALGVDRVSSREDKELVGVSQLEEILGDSSWLSPDELVVVTGDTYYSKPGVLYPLGGHDQLVTLARVRADRIFFRPAKGPDRRRKYGARFVTTDETTWGEPDEVWRSELVTQRGQPRHILVQGWHNLLMRGKRKPVPLRMFQRPFTLVRIVVTKPDGSPAFRRPLWVLVLGRRRAELSLAEVYHTYNARFRQEHLFRFVKQRLLLTCFQTPEVEREQQWWRFVFLAYLQLWVARPLAQLLPNPWERYRPLVQARARSPSMVQRDLPRLLAILGPMTQTVQTRGKPPGRPKGYRPQRRKRLSVVRKGSKKRR